jgi:hypothetical protein
MIDRTVEAVVLAWEGTGASLPSTSVAALRRRGGGHERLYRRLLEERDPRPNDPLRVGNQSLSAQVGAWVGCRARASERVGTTVVRAERRAARLRPALAPSRESNPRIAQARLPRTGCSRLAVCQRVSPPTHPGTASDTSRLRRPERLA